MDRNGVDMISGQPNLDEPTLSSAGISRKASHFHSLFEDNFTGYIPNWNSVPSPYPADNSWIINGERSVPGTDIFKVCDSAGNNCINVGRDGAQYIFDGTKISDGYNARPAIQAMLSEIIKPDGETLSISYATQNQEHTPTCIPQGQTEFQVCYFHDVNQYQQQAVTSSNGWMVKYELQTRTVNSPNGSWNVLFPQKIYIINISIDYCNPSSSSCTAADSMFWPTFNVNPTGTNTGYTDVNNASIGAYGDTVMVTPSGLTASYDLTGGRTNSAVYKGRTTTYAYTWEPETTGSPPYVITAKNSDGTTYSTSSPSAYYQFNPPITISYQTNGIATIEIDTTPINFYLAQPTSFTDELSQVTKYTYYNNNTAINADNSSVYQIFKPLLDYNQYTYDSRRNITSVSAYPTGGGNPLVTSYAYEASCNLSNYRFCNKVESVTDPNNNQTVYVYNPANGEVATETKAADANGVQPQTRYSYSQITPMVMNANGQLVASTPVYRLTRSSTCLSAVAGNLILPRFSGHPC